MVVCRVIIQGEGNKNKAEYCCTEFALNAAPMFPVPSKQTVSKESHFLRYSD